MSMHLFLSDQVLLDPNKQLINLEQLDLRVGYLDRVMIEHFVEPLEITDLRSHRVPILYRTEHSYLSVSYTHLTLPTKRIV